MISKDNKAKAIALTQVNKNDVGSPFTAGQVSDYKGDALLMDAIDALLEARELLADRGYDAD